MSRCIKLFAKAVIGECIANVIKRGKEKLIEAITNSILVVYGAVVTIITTIKNKKAKKQAEEQKSKITSFESQIAKAKIVAQLPELIKQAEELFPSAGEMKLGKQRKAYILKEVEIKCNEYEIDYTNEFSEHIELILETPQKKEKKGDA